VKKKRIKYGGVGRKSLKNISKIKFKCPYFTGPAMTDDSDSDSG